MSNQSLSQADIRKLQDITDAIRDLERTLAASSISGDLNGIAADLARLAARAQAPIGELGNLRGTLQMMLAFLAMVGRLSPVGEQIRLGLVYMWRLEQVYM